MWVKALEEREREREREGGHVTYLSLTLLSLIKTIGIWILNWKEVLKIPRVFVSVYRIVFICC